MKNSDRSEECIASIIRVIRIGEQGKMFLKEPQGVTSQKTAMLKSDKIRADRSGTILLIATNAKLGGINLGAIEFKFRKYFKLCNNLFRV
jgi:hypothetical protein